MQRTLLAAMTWLLLGLPLFAEDSSDDNLSIDRRLQQRLTSDGITPAPPADDAELFRRLSVDLIGRIPTAGEARAYLHDRDPDKYDREIDRMLASPAHAVHFANVWRALLLPEADADRQIRYFVPGFESWLQSRREQRVGFDVIVRDLLSVPITGTEQRPQLVLMDLRAANPIAFIAAKDADPAKLAATSVRLFLGIRLECAQCHNHPFDTWTQDQFWNQAAFFASIQKKGRGPFAPILEKPEIQSIAVMADPSKKVSAQYLDGHQAVESGEDLLRLRLAQWMTAAENPYFAKASVNRIWGQLMGRGIVDPVDDFHTANPASHPELLDELAASFANSGFDLTVLYRTLCRTQAYRRTSRQSDPSQASPQAFAKMAVKPMSGEQFFESLSHAIRREPKSGTGSMARNEDPVRRKFLETFGISGDQADPDTSVLQALTLMNGALIGDAASPDRSGVLQSFADAPQTDEQVLEILYLSTLSRLPTDSEQVRLKQYLQTGESPERVRRIGDVLWMLLNCAEFRWNH